VIGSNLREMSDPIITHWKYHLADSAAVALTLSPLLRQVLMSSGYAFTDLFAYGQHPLIDPMWSTETMRFVHFGGEVGRHGKLRSRVAQSDFALDNLIVCREERSEINCGRCGKCRRTMLMLAALGKLERCSTLPHSVTRKDAEHFSKHFDARRLLEDPEARWLPRDLERALWKKLKRRDMEYVLRELAKALRKRGPLWSRVVQQTWGRLHRRGLL
jgi:hypothetical protein